MPLTASQAEQARAKWLTGEVSASALGAEFGITRNAVLGYAHRWRQAGLVPDVKKRAPKAEASPAGEPEQHPAPPPKPAPLRPDVVTSAVPTPIAPKVQPPHRLPVLGAGPATAALCSRDCRWPMGDPTDERFHFCCAPVERGPKLRPPYCKAHLRRAAASERALRVFGVDAREAEHTGAA